jgi:hypothetical protein
MIASADEHMDSNNAKRHGSANKARNAKDAARVQLSDVREAVTRDGGHVNPTD